MKPRLALALSLALTAAFVVGVVALALTWTPPRPPGPKIVRGVGTATDGRVALAIDGYYYASAQAIGFTRIDPDNQFLVVNLTFSNVGNQNVSVSTAFFVFMANGATNLSNTWWDEPASLPGPFPWPPNNATPFQLVLPPGGTARGWMAFYLRGVTPPDFPRQRFLNLVYTYYDYGNEHDLAVRFIIAPR